MKFTAAKPYSLSLNNQGLPTTIIFLLFDFSENVYLLGLSLCNKNIGLGYSPKLSR